MATCEQMVASALAANIRRLEQSLENLEKQAADLRARAQRAAHILETTGDVGATPTFGVGDLGETAAIALGKLGAYNALQNLLFDVMEGER